MRIVRRFCATRLHNRHHQRYVYTPLLTTSHDTSQTHRHITAPSHFVGDGLQLHRLLIVARLHRHGWLTISTTGLTSTIPATSVKGRRHGTIYYAQLRGVFAATYLSNYIWTGAILDGVIRHDGKVGKETDENEDNRVSSRTLRILHRRTTRAKQTEFCNTDRKSVV